MITLRRIINLINYDIPIQYYDINEGKQYAHLLYLKSISDKEQIVFDKLTEREQEEYISNTAQIYIPRLTVYNCAERYRRSVSYDLPYTLHKVQKIIPISKEDEDTAFALYMILHEFGHWHDFLRLGRKPYAFNMPDLKQAKAVWEYGNRIQQELNGKSILTDWDKKRLKNFIERYYAVPIESRANQYADEKYLDAYSLLKKNGIVK